MYAGKCLDVLFLKSAYIVCAAEQTIKDSFPQQESFPSVSGILGWGALCTSMPLPNGIFWEMLSRLPRRDSPDSRLGLG